MKHLETKQQTTRILTTAALLVALHVVLSEYLSLTTPYLKTNFGFLPLMFAGMLYGPTLSVSVAVVGDILGVALFPQPTGFYPGFTLTSALVGLCYGLLLYKKEGEFSGSTLYLRAALCCFFINGLLYTGLNSFWLVQLSGLDAVRPMMPLRILNNVLLFGLQFILIPVVYTLKTRLVRLNLVTTR